MRAFIVDTYGTDARLRAGEWPEPAVGARDVLVRVEAAGVNPLDAKIMAGEFRQILPYRTPFVLGNDLAGVVERVGPAVLRFQPGDRVYARPDEGRIGTFAELIAVDEADLATIPAGLTAEESASLPLVALTAWQALVEVADVRPGQKVLVHAGSGGLGSIAIQLAKHLGAHVATTAGTANVDRVRELGADEVVDHRTTDFETVLSGFDVVLDSLGPDNLVKSLRVLRRGGLAISVAGPPDPAFADRLGKPLLRPVLAMLSWKVRRAARRLGVRYSFLLMRADGAQLQEITSLVEAGVLRPVVDRVFPFDETAAAVDVVGSGRARGKVVVSMAPVTRTSTSQTPTRGEPS